MEICPLAGLMIAPWTKAAWPSLSSWHGPAAGSVAVSRYGVARPSGVSGFSGTMRVQFGSVAAAGAAAPPGVVVVLNMPVAPRAMVATAPTATIASTETVLTGWATTAPSGPRRRRRRPGRTGRGRGERGSSPVNAYGELGSRSYPGRTGPRAGPRSPYPGGGAAAAAARG